MPDGLTLTPLPLPPESPAPSPGDGKYAPITESEVHGLARSVPDAQSAVLLLLTWEATRNARLRLGPLAGRRAASSSGGQLAAACGRPLRTVRHALAQLLARGLVNKEAVPAGRKNVYTLPWLDGGRAADAPTSVVAPPDGGQPT